MLAELVFKRAADDFLVAMAAAYAAIVGAIGRRQIGAGVGDELQQVRASGAGGGREDVVERSRGQRQRMVGVADVEAAAFAGELDFAGLDRAAVVVAEDWHKDAVVKLLLVRLPIDVEVGGIAAGGAVFQNVPPPAIA